MYDARTSCNGRHTSSSPTLERQDLISAPDNETPSLYQNNDQIVPLTGSQGGNKEIDHSNKTSKSGYRQVKSQMEMLEEKIHII